MIGPRQILGLCYIATLAQCDASVSTVTATTTVTASESGACENFVGACVVYGSGGAAPYTTTVYASDASSSPASKPSPTTVTSTTTVYISYIGSSLAASAALSPCESFTGACVVYATNPAGTTTYTTTFHNSPPVSSSSSTSGGSGYIGSGSGGGSNSNNPGFIAAAPPLSMWTIGPIIGLALVNLGFLFFM